MLERKVTFMSGLAIAISMVIGSGLFALPGLAIETTDPITALAGWLFVIAIMPAMIWIFSYMGSRYSSAEGIALFASMALGEWSKKGVSLVVCGTLAVGMPAFFMVGGAYTAELFNLDTQTWTIPIGILLAVVTTAINLMGAERLGLINKIVVICVLGLVIYLVSLSLASYSSTITDLPAVYETWTFEVSSVWLASSIVFWAFQGWENLTFGLGEVRDPEKTVRKIFWVSFAVVSLVYIFFSISASLAQLSGVSIEGISGLSALVGDGVLSKVLLLFIVVILIANANSWVFGASRAFYSAARNGVLPASIGRLNAANIPANSLIGALGFHTIVMMGMWLFAIHPKFAFLLTTQGFILLYGGTIIAYMRLARGLLNILIGLFALLSWLFLMQGFGVLILYSMSLFILGVVLHLRKGGAIIFGKWKLTEG